MAEVTVISVVQILGRINLPVKIVVLIKNMRTYEKRNVLNILA